MEFTSGEIARATGGRQSGPDQTVDRVVLDVNTLGESDRELFVALVHRWDRDDTHRFLDRAHRRVAAYVTERPPVGGTAIVVANAEEAMHQIGELARTRTTDRVIAITGSVGKTTTKDLVAAALAPTHRVHASPRSFNTLCSVPMVLANTPDGTDAVVLEIGGRYVGQVGHLARLARPKAAVITRIGPAHLGTFGSLERIAQGKGELVEHVAPDGVAILDADDPWTTRIAPRAAAEVIRFGTDPSADVRATRVDIDADLALTISVTSPWGEAEVRPPCRGPHQVGNVLAALAAACSQGVPIDSAAAAVAEAELSGQRMEVRRTPHGIRMIDDTYNSTPASVEAALRSLAAVPARRRLAVLGPVVEGPLLLDDLHRDIALLADDLGIDLVAYKTGRYGIEPAEDAAEVWARVAALGPDDIILVKGSRHDGLEDVVTVVAGEA